MDKNTRQAAVYCRISQDRSGEELGVTRQRADCEKIVVREGWTTAAVYVDDDRSAYNGKPRPDYLRMLEDIRNGRINAVIAWHPDRLHGPPRELEDFIDLVEKIDVPVRTVMAGQLDLSTPSGRMTARVVCSVARHERELKGARASRKMQELAEAGKYTGGTRLFGYTKDFQVIDAEAEIVRELAKRLLAGESLGSLARDLNERGIRTTRGGKYNNTGVRNLLKNPRMAGLKVYKGETIGDAPWEPILDRATHESLKKKAAANAHGLRPARKRLLAGFLYCGLCDHRLLGAVYSSGRPCYRCPTDAGHPGRSGCGGISIVGDSLDDDIRDRLLARLSGPGLAEALEHSAGDDVRRQEATALLVSSEASLTELGNDFYQERLISRGEFLEQRKALTARIESAQRELRSDPGTGMLAELPSDATKLREAWDSGDLARRRAMLGTIIDRVTIAKGVHGQRFRRDRASVTWKA